MKYIIIFLLTLYAIGLSAQKIEGVVFESGTNKSLKNVHIEIKGSNVGTVTDAKGKFELKIDESRFSANDLVTITMVGYRTREINLAELSKGEYIIYLKKKAEVIDEVVVKAKKLKNTLPFFQVAKLKTGVYGFGSLFLEDTLYIVGGDQSQQHESVKAAVKNMSDIFGEWNPEQFTRELRKNNNKSFRKYSKLLRQYGLVNSSWNYPDLDIENRAYHNVINHDSKIYILGGKTISRNGRFQYLSNIIDVYDTTTGRLVKDYTNPHQAVNPTSIVYQNSMVVFGGSTKLRKNGKLEFTDKVHFMDFKTGLWYELTKMTKAKETKSVVVDQKVFLIGGFNNKSLSDIESFDMITGEWEKEGYLPRPIAYPAVTSYKGIIYVFDDGRLYTYDQNSNLILEYKVNLFISEAQIHIHNNILYIIGGKIADEYSIEPSVKIWGISMDEFDATKPIRHRK